MKVSDVMTYGGLTCRQGDRLQDAVRKMVMRRCGALPVVADDDEGRLIGILTIRDSMLPLYPNFGEFVYDSQHARNFEEMEENYGRVMRMQVKEVMTPDPMTVTSTTPVLEAASYMGLRNLRRLPVVDDDRLVGMISIGDICRGMFIALG